MPLKAVFFDLDGTLLDTAPDFVVTLRALAQEYQLPCPPDDAIRQTVSDGASALTQLLFQCTPQTPGFEAKRQRLLTLYGHYRGRHCQLFAGMYTLLLQLERQGLIWGIITNKPQRFTQPIIENLTLPSAPNLVLCPDHVSQPKPHPEALLLACTQSECTPAEAIYIGDHKRDIDCGLQAGCETIAVRFGYIHQNDAIEDWRAQHIVAHGDEIWPIIQTRLQQR